MKPFNLEEAKAGKPVCTRDGRAARIVCFDAKNEDFPIVALIDSDGDGVEVPETFTTDGYYYRGGGNKDIDLLMLTLTLERTVWVNLYAIDGDTPHVGLSYASEAQARDGVDHNRRYLGTIPITYEE